MEMRGEKGGHHVDGSICNEKKLSLCDGVLDHAHLYHVRNAHTTIFMHMQESENSRQSPRYYLHAIRRTLNRVEVWKKRLNLMARSMVISMRTFPTIYLHLHRHSPRPS